MTGKVILLKSENNISQIILKEVMLGKNNTIDLKPLQMLVGGNIELINWSNKLINANIDMWCDEEGKLKEDLKPSCCLTDDNTNKVVDVIVGNVVLAGHDMAGNTVPLTDTQIDIALSVLQNPVRLGYASGEDIIISMILNS